MKVLTESNSSAEQTDERDREVGGAGQCPWRRAVAGNDYRLSREHSMRDGIASLNSVGSMVRTVWLGRTMVHGRSLVAFSIASQAILFWL
jgi:hypothetical protein